MNMKLSVNGETREVSATTVGALLRELDVLPGRVAVEVNFSIVKKADYDSFSLQEDDAVEVVNFVGGGYV